VAGQGRFVADIRLPGMLECALVTSPYPRARILEVNREAARALPGVHEVLSGLTLAAQVTPLTHGIEVAGIAWYPLAVDCARYVGEWVAVVVAEDRYVAEDAVELVDVSYEPLTPVVDVEAAMEPDSPIVHEAVGTNVIYRRTFTWNDVDDDFESAPERLSHRVRWGRSSTVPIETFGVVAAYDPGTDLLDIWASIQMPKFSEQIATALRIPHSNVRVHYDVDVGGSYGVKRGLKHAVLVGYLARQLGRPVRLLEDRLENMIGGDAHGPDRIFDIDVAFERDGRVRSLIIRALDDCGAFPGRSVLQLGKPIGAITGPYRIGSVRYEAICVCTNKTGQVAVRGFGQAPTNFALEATMDRVAAATGMDRLEVRRHNYIQSHEFPYRIPSGTEYDSGDYETVHQKLLDRADWPTLVARRDALRAKGMLAGIGFASVLEPSGGNAAFEPLLNPHNDTTTWMESCFVKVDHDGCVTTSIATPTSGQAHETLMATVIGEELGIEPELIRVVHADTLTALPGNTPVASRMAIMMGGAAAGAARQIRDTVIAIGAHDMQVRVDEVEYANGDVVVRGRPDECRTWMQIVAIAHRQYHRMPPGFQPGLQAHFVYQVPKGERLPAADGTVQMYPCYAFEAHLPLVEIDPVTGRVRVREYYVGHDCGTIINPGVVRGMLIGGIAHGIGAALLEEFRYDSEGQPLVGTLLDYPMPTTLDIPDVQIVEHCTPSPLTSHGQKGAGESGYMGAPAAIASAVNDALGPLGLRCERLPIRLTELGERLAAASRSGTLPAPEDLQR